MRRTALFRICTALALGAASFTGAAPAPRRFVLVAHAGAGDYGKIAPELIAKRRVLLAEAMRAGYAVLASGGTSLDAVETTIRAMEDSGEFNCGRGAFYTRDGVPEMDAAIMDGRTLAAGAVASLRRVANPIHLARLVAERSPHVMLVGTGAEEFARSQGIELVSPLYFYSEREWQRYEKARTAERQKAAAAVSGHGTVGVVALDSDGNLAAGTSTGGTVLKMPGRVGDSPLIGAGTYANNAGCAVSATGTGEYFIRNVVAADICARVRYAHESLDQAATEVVMKVLVEQHGDGGVIALDPSGNVAAPYNTKGMLYGVVREDGSITLQGWDPAAKPVVVR